MVRFSSAVLMRVHRFLLEIHAVRDIETQRRLIPRRISEMIACDRPAINEFAVGASRTIIPFPVPAYWSQLSPILANHLHEHVLASPLTSPIPHRTATFGDRRHDPAWRKST